MQAWERSLSSKKEHSHVTTLILPRAEDSDRPCSGRCPVERQGEKRTLFWAIEPAVICYTAAETDTGMKLSSRTDSAACAQPRAHCPQGALPDNVLSSLKSR